MSDPSLPGDEAEVIGATPSPLGAQLREARENQGLDIERVSHRLNISGRYIAAMEADAFDQLPGAAFARGYLRSYGRLLGLDGDALIAEFNRRQGDEALRPVATITKVRRQASFADPLVRGGALVLVLTLVGFSVWWWQAQTTPARSVPAASTAPAGSAEVGAPSLQAPPQDAEETRRLEPEAPVPEQAAASSDAPEPESESEPEPQNLTDEDIARLAAQLERDAESASSEESPTADAAVSAEDQVAVVAAPSQPLVVRFVDECWVTLKDAEGRNLVAQIFKAGDVLEMAVPTPANLLIGKVSAVESAEFAGKPLALESRSRQNVARLTLSAP